MATYIFNRNFDMGSFKELTMPSFEGAIANATATGFTLFWEEGNTTHFTRFEGADLSYGADGLPDGGTFSTIHHHDGDATIAALSFTEIDKGDHFFVNDLATAFDNFLTGSLFDALSLILRQPNTYHANYGAEDSPDALILYGFGSSNSFSPDVGSHTIYGGSKADILYSVVSGSHSNIIYGGSGDDEIEGIGQNTYLYGENGIDEITGGVGTQYIYGGDGNDKLYGGVSHDMLYGNKGSDLLEGQRGKDKLYGGKGHDRLQGGDHRDILYGGAGNDKLYGESGNDVLYGGAGNDKLYGESGNDVLYGAAGNDDLRGGSGKDKLYGGKGADIFRFDNITDSAIGKNRDVIMDFDLAEGDLINIFGAVGFLKNIGTDEFSGNGNEFRLEEGGNKGQHTIIIIDDKDVGIDGTADMELKLRLITIDEITSDYFFGGTI